MACFSFPGISATISPGKEVTHVREEILNRLRRLSPEEERLLRGEEVRREDYGRTEGDFCVESGQLMPSGEMISLRPHTLSLIHISSRVVT